MKQGEIVTQGQPQAVMTPENLRRILDVEACVYPSPVNGKLMIQNLKQKRGSTPQKEEPL